MMPPANGLPIVTDTWCVWLCWRPSVLPGPMVRPKTLSDMNVTLSLRPAAASCCMSALIVATPDTVCVVSPASPTSRWLSPPNGMWIEITGVTFIWISVTAARICELALLSVIELSVDSKLWLMLRTCVCDVTSESMYAFCAGLALVL